MADNREVRVKRILYQTWYRGCKETDRILGHFAKSHIDDFDDSDLNMLETIMSEDDKDLWKWISGKEPLPKEYNDNKIMKLLLSFNVSSIR